VVIQPLFKTSVTAVMLASSILGGENGIIVFFFTNISERKVLVRFCA
jgi:hypothetical protein